MQELMDQTLLEDEYNFLREVIISEQKVLDDVEHGILELLPPEGIDKVKETLNALLMTKDLMENFKMNYLETGYTNTHHLIETYQKIIDDDKDGTRKLPEMFSPDVIQDTIKNLKITKELLECEMKRWKEKMDA